MDGKSIMEVMLETAQDIGVSKITMRKIEALALPEIHPLTPEEIKEIREQFNLSQAVWSRLLNVGATTVRKWERGETSPDGASMKLLNIVKANGVEILIH
jgi:putative transcriptional regulator